MPESIQNRLKHAYNAFMNRDPPKEQYYGSYGVSDFKSSRNRFNSFNERSIITNVYNRIAIDCAACPIKHVRLDENDRYVSEMTSGLNECLTIEANKDQTGRAMIQDVVMTMFYEGVAAIVPVDTTINPAVSTSYDILSMRVGKITDWRPDYVRVELYNDKKGVREELWLPKKRVGIVINPLYDIMNEPNSIVQRLLRKLNMLDSIDEQSSSGKLDLIIQLPYSVKSPVKMEQAEQRRKAIADQLQNSKYGIAYIDSTEHITQLNRSLENNLMNQIQYLIDLAYSQIGITKSILEGTANEQELLNYNNRTVEPILAAITDEMKRKFLTKTARTQKQSIIYYHDPFRLVPVGELAKLADTFTRNEIMSSNEWRQILGLVPDDSEEANQLRNKNLYAPAEEEEYYTEEPEEETPQ